MSTPERVLRLQGATNFRDLGGYRGRGGRPLRWRRLFRSDHLGQLTDADRATLAGLGLTRAFDFRGERERAADPYHLPGLAQHSLAIEPTVAQRMADLAASGRSIDAPGMVELMQELYRRLVDEQSARWADWFGHLLADDAPMVFHCTAGKDRTGVAAALLLLALEVPLEVVEHDYLLTNQHYRRPAGMPSTLPEEALAVLWSVRPEFLRAALAAIERRHGSVPRYLQMQLGLGAAERDRLAELYLEGG